MKDSSYKIFDRIFKRYDFLNHFLSAGFDFYWRRKLATSLPDQPNLDVLDLATGTGDLAFSMMKHRRQNIATVVGMDLSENMLDLARQKLAKQAPAPIRFETGDAAAIPLPDNSMDVVTISFGIRNVTAYKKAFKDMARVLRPGGILLVLECSIPRNRVIRFFYLIYFRHVLPFLGRLLSGDDSAYRYLNQTVETFPQRQTLCDAMLDNGFVSSRWDDLTAGTVTLYHAHKSS